MSALFPDRVKLVEVGPRDGLQNEPGRVETATKIEFIQRLAETGLPVIEATSFVSPRWVPQLADAEAVYAGVQRQLGVRYPVLVPNQAGLERALAAGVADIAVFTGVTETFCQKNIHCSVAESLDRYQPVIAKAREKRLGVRAYLSCVLGCPYEGPVAARQVARLARWFAELGVDEISLGDTIGVGTPLQAQRLLATVAEEVPLARLAVHFHDTYGQALANIFACLELGVSVIDSAVAGLGGCPYAKGATGNVATEDVVYMLEGMGIETGVDLKKLIGVGRHICQALERENQSRVGRAGISR
ncbi:hydroxymethylglutaryl-CoA lyase [Nitrosococcus oceani]|uniref:hydroxymethylglutaryl-CoA lyase n=1 Tax=Nitrosococcus oceani TaxID=1229 RepID=UPI0004E9479A|nr:hydroxymethylglutaryl-CoA lyase [Nitrosococcus oceani]KFI22443.1 hydroxymethylglutaryl-CoA lyase [Nitrosococcus oceani]